MSFQEYIKTRKVTDNPRGDFINDAQKNIDFTNKAFTNWESVESYLLNRNANMEAIKECKKLRKADIKTIHKK